MRFPERRFDGHIRPPDESKETGYGTQLQETFILASKKPMELSADVR